MHIIWMIVFGAMMIYVAWWLIYSIRTRVVFEVFMALGVGSLWTAFFAPKLFSDSPTLVNWPLTVSRIGYSLPSAWGLWWRESSRCEEAESRPTPGSRPRC